MAIIELEPITVSVQQGERLTGLSRITLWRKAKDGELETIKVGRRVLIVYASLKRLLTPGTEAMR
jgi:excisionase family DNA binding protein